MKIFFTFIYCVAAFWLTNADVIAQSQTTTVPCNSPYPGGGVSTCPQTNWATPYLTTESGVRVNSGQLQPGTIYKLVLEAYQSVAPCSSIIVVTLGDGFINYETGQPFNGGFGADVPNGQKFPGYPYKIFLRIQTNSGADFVSQLYFKYRMECSAAAGYGTVGGGSRVPSAQKQALLP